MGRKSVFVPGQLDGTGEGFAVTGKAYSAVRPRPVPYEYDYLSDKFLWRAWLARSEATAEWALTAIEAALRCNVSRQISPAHALNHGGQGIGRSHADLRQTRVLGGAAS